MAKVLVLQHSPYEPLGIIVHTLRRMKFRMRYVNFYRNPEQRIDIARYDAMVVLGGQQHPNQIDAFPFLRHEIELICSALQRDTPVLGICLGSQLLNLALGGSCYSLSRAEYGWHRLSQMKDAQFSPSFTEGTYVFQWHQYASRLSKDASCILENENCVQAFRFNNSLGLQFHLEVDEALIRRWLQHPDYIEHLKKHIGPIEMKKIHRDTERYLSQSMNVGQDIFRQFCEGVGKKVYGLSSKSAGRDLYH